MVDLEEQRVSHGLLPHYILIIEYEKSQNFQILCEPLENWFYNFSQ